MDSDKKYYSDQLDKVNTESEYKPKIVIQSPPGGLSTNYMDVNKDSAEVLVKWLTENFINK